MVAIEHYAKASTILATTSEIGNELAAATGATAETITTTTTTNTYSNNNNNGNQLNNNNNNNGSLSTRSDNNNTTTTTAATATQSLESATCAAVQAAAATTTTSNNKIPPKIAENLIVEQNIRTPPPPPLAAAVTATTTTKASSMSEQLNNPSDVAASCKSAVSQRSVDIKIGKKSNTELAKQDLTKKMLKLDLSGKELDDYSLKSPKSPITARLPHQTSLTSSVDVEDRKTLRDALYQGIFHRHRRTIFAVGSFLRMLRSRNSQYNSIRSSSEGEDVDDR